MQTIYSQTRFTLNSVGIVNVKSRGQIRAILVPITKANDVTFIDNLLNNTSPVTIFQARCDGKHVLIVEPVDSRADVEISYGNKNSKQTRSLYGRAAGKQSLSEWWSATSNIYKALVMVISVVALLLVIFAIWMTYNKYKGGNKLRYTVRY